MESGERSLRSEAVLRTYLFGAHFLTFFKTVTSKLTNDLANKGGIQMKLRNFSLILLLFFVSITSAQRMMRQRAEPIDWVKKLDLTDEQAKQMAEIQEYFRSKMMSMMDNPSGDRMGMMYAMQDIQKERDKKIKKILNKQQYKKYDKELKAQQKERRRRMEERGGGEQRRRQGQRKQGN